MEPVRVMSVWARNSGERLGSQCDGLVWGRRCRQPPQDAEIVKIRRAEDFKLRRKKD